MKKLLLLTVGIVSLLWTSAQSPNSFQYQAIARSSATETPMPSKHMSARFTIRNGGLTGSIFFEETDTFTTTDVGLINVAIGNGNIVTGTIAGIPWSADSAKYLEVEIDTAGGTSFSVMGASQILSVPYALYAANSGGNFYGLNGNSGTNSGSNFLGTTDSVNLEFRVNNTPSGKIENTGNQSTALGYGALAHETYSSGSGSNGNTAFGTNTLGANTSGQFNTAFGTGALKNNTTASSNTAVGIGALSFITSGSFNTAIGNGTLWNDSSGSYNTAIGAMIMVSATGTHCSTALGVASEITRNYQEIHSDSTFEIDYGNATREVLNFRSADSLQFKYGNSKWSASSPHDTFSINNIKVLQYQDGNQANGKVLTSDASGNATWQGGFSGSSAGGDLSGTYPNPTVAKINGVALGTTTATSGNLLIGSGSQWQTEAISGDVAITSGGASTVSTVNGNSVAQVLYKTDSTGKTFTHGGTNVILKLSSTPALGTYSINWYVNVTANSLSGSGCMANAQVLFTDENSTSQTMNFNPLPSSGFSPSMVPAIRCKSGTSVTVQIVSSGCTSGTVSYDAGGDIDKRY